MNSLLFVSFQMFFKAECQNSKPFPVFNLNLENKHNMSLSLVNNMHHICCPLNLFFWFKNIFFSSCSCSLFQIWRNTVYMVFRPSSHSNSFAPSWICLDKIVIIERLFETLEIAQAWITRAKGANPAYSICPCFIFIL